MSEKLKAERFYALREPLRESKVVIDGWDCVTTKWDIGAVRVAWHRAHKMAVFCVEDGSLSCHPNVPGTVVAWLVQSVAPPAPPLSLAPVAGDRLLASLACHIDHDEPPGMAASMLARTILELVKGLSSPGAVYLALHIDKLKTERAFIETAKAHPDVSFQDIVEGKVPRG